MVWSWERTIFKDHLNFPIQGRVVISYLFSIFLDRAGQKGAEQLSSLKESVLLSRIQIHVLEINTKYSIVGIHGV